MQFIAHSLPLPSLEIAACCDDGVESGEMSLFFDHPWSGPRFELMRIHAALAAKSRRQRFDSVAPEKKRKQVLRVTHKH